MNASNQTQEKQNFLDDEKVEKKKNCSMARKIAVYAVVTSVVHIEGIGAKSVFIITALGAASARFRTITRTVLLHSL